MSKSILTCLITIFLFGQCKNDCIDVYGPVCGRDGKNYLNACQANTLRVRYTQGLCTLSIQGKVINLNKASSTDCDWVFKIDSFFKDSTIEETFSNLYFSMHNFPDEFKENELEVEITYTSVSDAIGTCYLNDTDYHIIYMSVVDLKKI